MSSLLLPGMMLPGSTGTLSNPQLAPLGPNAVPGQKVPGQGPVASIKSLLGVGDVPRIVTGLLGLLLIAAAIFTHPTVINVGKKVGKTAGEAGLLA